MAFYLPVFGCIVCLIVSVMADGNCVAFDMLIKRGIDVELNKKRKKIAFAIWLVTFILAFICAFIYIYECFFG